MFAHLIFFCSEKGSRCGLNPRHVDDRPEVDRSEVERRQVHPLQWHGRDLHHHVPRRQVLHLNNFTEK